MRALDRSPHTRIGRRTLTRRAALRSIGLGVAGGGLIGANGCASRRENDELVFGFSGDTVGIATYRQAAALYRRRNPTVRLRVTYADPLGFFQRLPLMFRAGTAPDVMIVAESWVSGLGQLGGYQDLRDLLRRDEVDEKQWLPGAMNPARIGDALLCIPCVVFPKGIAYNRDLFAERGVPEPGPEWREAEYVEAAAALAHDTGSGRVWGMRNAFGTSQPYDVPTIHGGLPFDPDTRRMTATDPRVVSSLQLLSGLVHRHHAMPGAAQIQDTVDFTSGRFGMDLFAGYFLTGWSEQIGSRFDWRVVPHPVEWFGTYQNTNIAIFSGSRQQEAAWDFAKFLSTDPEAQRLLGRIGTPALRSATDSWRSSLPEHIRAFDWDRLFERMDRQLVAYQGGVFNKVWDAFGQQVQAVQNRGKPVHEALRELQERGQEILRV